MNISKTYTKTDKENTELKTLFYYDLGGFNYFTGKEEGRGYYILIQPVEISRNENGGVSCETFTAFKGIKSLLTECKRKSKKMQRIAEMRLLDKRQNLLQYVADKNNLIIQ